ncbi:MAG: hypothetical protein PUH96_08130 [Coriobacteriaceae bacterium]|nr:hypothetical protein [Coriobacteriaceae bacterium]
MESYGTDLMVVIAVPCRLETAAGIQLESCFTGLDVGSVITVEQLQGSDNKTYCRLFSNLTV